MSNEGHIQLILRSVGSYEMTVKYHKLAKNWGGDDNSIG